MPLVLGIDLGHSFYVGESLRDGHPSKGKVTVTEIKNARSFTVAVESATGTKTFAVSDVEGVEVLAAVYLSCGKRGTSEMARVLITAPRYVQVRREGVAVNG